MRGPKNLPYRCVGHKLFFLPMKSQSAVRLATAIFFAAAYSAITLSLILCAHAQDVTINDNWKFRADPGSVGMDQHWMDSNYDDSAWNQDWRGISSCH